MATFASGSWQILSGALVDSSAGTASATTMHLSPYALVTTSVAAPTCATVYGGLTCRSIIGGSSSGAGGSVSGGSGAGGSVDAAQPDTPDCVPTTCAGSSDVCAPYPGAAATSCSDGPGGYTATCCFPAGGKACLATMQFEGCSVIGPDGGYTDTCPNPPRCATDTFACSQWSGATLQDCTDNSNGYSGACCFPAGQPVCYVISSGGYCEAADGATGCTLVSTCEEVQPASFCAAGTTMSSCTNNSGGFDVTCCYPLGTLPDTGTMPTGGTTGAGGIPTGGVSGGGGLGGSGGLGGVGGRGGGSGGISDGEGGVGPGPTGAGGNPGSGGLFGPGKGGTG